MKTQILDLATCRAALKPRSKDAHKGHFGHVLVVGGDYGMAGAVLLASEAALRAGAGRVTVATRPEHALSLFTGLPEVMTHALKEPKDIEAILHRVTVILLGPGLGQKEFGRELFQTLMQTDLPMVVDADALNILSSDPHLRENWILTPHPGEAARLLGCSTESIQHDRIQSIQELKRQYHGTIILKGAGSLVLGQEDEQPKLCEQGNPGMATAGMGDVLSGLLAGLIGQGLSHQAAAELAVVAHATAGDFVKEEHGERGILSGDILEYIPRCLNP